MKRQRFDIDASEIDLSILPYSLRRIVESIGFAQAHKLLSALGGTRIRLRRGAQSVEAVEDVIGRDLCRKLMDTLSSDRNPGLRDEAPVITLPKIDKLMTQLRDTAIANAAERGETDASIASRFHLTERWVSKIKLGQSRKRTPSLAARQQRDLFDAA